MHHRLSPFNFAQLIANGRHEQALAAEQAQVDAERQAIYGTSRRAIECWRCPECLDVHDDEFEAEECCADSEPAKSSNPTCPVCRLEHVDHHAAADCCLWRDLAPPARWAVADAVERGATWTKALGVAA